MEKGLIFNTDESTKLRNQEEICNFCQDNVNVKMPMDGPLW